MTVIKCMNEEEFFERDMHGRLENPGQVIKCTSIEDAGGFKEPTVIATIAEDCNICWTDRYSDEHVTRHLAGEKIIVAKKFIAEVSE